MTDVPAEKKFVLVLEDSCDHAESLLLLLQIQGYRAECAPDGRSGLNRVQAELPDLVMLDMAMPELHGADVGQALRSSDAAAGIPLLIQTSHPEWQVREWFNDYDAYLQKPFDIPRMLKIVADLLRGKVAAA